MQSYPSPSWHGGPLGALPPANFLLPSSLEETPRSSRENLIEAPTKSSRANPNHARLELRPQPQQGERDHPSQGFIKQELQDLKEELLSEMAKMRAESSATMTSMQNFFTGRDSQAEDTLKKIFDERLKISMVDVGHGSALRAFKPDNGHDSVDSAEAFNKKSSTTQDRGCSPTVRFPVDLEEALAREISGAEGSKSRASLPSSKTAQTWVDLHQAIMQVEDEHNWYKHITDKRHFHERSTGSWWHRLFNHLGYEDLLPRHKPTSPAAQLTYNPLFIGCQALLILANTFLMGYEANLSIEIALDTSGRSLPNWIHHLELAFTIAFALEVGFRVLVLHAWFWVAPMEWGWNIFDLLVVLCSIITESTTGLNLKIFRAFRVIRAVRAMRVVRILRFFREVRKVLFAIVGCFVSLMWCFLFLILTTYMFSIFLLQGLVLHLDDMQNQPIDVQTIRRTEIQTWFSSLAHSMLSLVASFTGGTDWMPLTEPLQHAGTLYSAAFVGYMLFVVVGVMNVLTGVFLSNADEFADHSLVVQNEFAKIESFVEHMLSIFKEMDHSGSGVLDSDIFHKALANRKVQAYLSAHGLEPTHARLIFLLLDEKCEGKINLLDFIFGMLRLKGEAKAIDARIIQRKIDLLPDFLSSSSSKGSTLI